MDMFDKFKNLFPRPATGPVEYIVAGLGNPGRQYENTKHNIGYLTVERLAQLGNCKVNRLRFKSLCGETELGGHKVLLLKPSTFMNLSGEAVVQALQFYKLPVTNLIVVCDDVALPPGKLRIRKKGSDGGHNGLKNIIYLTGRDDFPRIRIGVGGKPHQDYDLAQWVLTGFDKDSLPQMHQAVEDACAALEMIVRGNMDNAMNKYN